MKRFTWKRIAAAALAVGLAWNTAMPLPLFAQDAALETEVVTPIEQFSCSEGQHNITAQLLPALEKKQVANVNGNFDIGGAVLAPSDDMDIEINGQMAEKDEGEHGNTWTRTISPTASVAITTSSGPDNLWVGFGGRGFKPSPVSLDVDQDNTYDHVTFSYQAIGNSVTGCLLGYGAVAPNYEIYVNGVLANTVVGGQKAIDLLGWNVSTQPGDLIGIQITAQGEYLFVGQSISGVIGDPGVNPGDPEPPQPEPWHECSISVGTSPVVGQQILFNQVVEVYINTAGECGEAVFLNHEGLGRMTMAPSGCYVITPNAVRCSMDMLRQGKLTFAPTQSGQIIAFVTRRLPPNAARYWGGTWEALLEGLWLPLTMK